MISLEYNKLLGNDIILDYSHNYLPFYNYNLTYSIVTLWETNLLPFIILGNQSGDLLPEKGPLISAISLSKFKINWIKMFMLLFLYPHNLESEIQKLAQIDLFNFSSTYGQIFRSCLSFRFNFFPWLLLIVRVSFFLKLMKL